MSILDKDLDECRSFHEVSKWRAEKYKIDRKSGDDYTGILTNIYKEPTHFIYELLQNADDANASDAKFVLSKDKIEFFHNGSKEFVLSDIIAITGVGNSSKGVDDKKSIGKFGVGFKAVFAVTDKPLIYSKAYNFQIENLSVPSVIPERDLEGFTTIFQLNFKHKNCRDLFSRNEALLRSMSPETILFLRNICKIDIVINDEVLDEISVKRTMSEQFFSRVKYVSDGKDVELLKFTSNNCSLVYRIEGGTVMPLVESKVSVFFPTIISSGLPFLVDAPFQTSTTRESIDFHLSHNISIIKLLGKLFDESIGQLKRLNLFTSRTFNEVMPIDCVNEPDKLPVYQEFQSVFLRAIRSRSFVPTSYDELVAAPGVCISRDLEVVELLQNAIKLHFAHPDLSDAAIKFIIKAGADEFSSLRLLSLISRKEINLSSQTDEWLYKLYEYCLKLISCDGWSKIFTRTIKITLLIRTRAGGFVAAYCGDNPNVFRPSKGIADDRTIHSMFLSDAVSVSSDTRRKMRLLLSEMGITERKSVVVLKEDYFKAYTTKSSQEKRAIFEVVSSMYAQSESKDKKDIIEYLKNIAFIPSEDGEFKLATKLCNAYNPNLQYLLGERCPELFCSRWVAKNAAHRNLCLDLGMVDYLKVDKIESRRSDREGFIELYESTGSRQGYGVSTKDYIRQNYNSAMLSLMFLNKLTVNTTTRLVPLLQQIEPSQLKESFEWTYYGSKKEAIGPSELHKLLADTCWIAKDDRMVRPIDMSFDDFCSIYKVSRDNVLQNLEWSNDDIIKRLSREDQGAIRLMRELNLSSEEMLDIRRTTLERRKKTQRLIDRQAISISESCNNVQLGASEDEEGVSSLNDATREQVDMSALRASEQYEAADVESEKSISTHIVASSGWSNIEHEEREVLKHLIGQYKDKGYVIGGDSDNAASYVMRGGGDTVRLMLLSKNNSGYNIEISRSGKIIETVTVIKADFTKKRFIISEAQWGLSKRSDVRHLIYLVSSQNGKMSWVMINDLRKRIQSGSVRAIPGVIYY